MRIGELCLTQATFLTDQPQQDLDAAAWEAAKRMIGAETASEEAPAAASTTAPTTAPAAAEQAAATAPATAQQAAAPAEQAAEEDHYSEQEAEDDSMSGHEFADDDDHYFESGRGWYKNWPTVPSAPVAAEQAAATAPTEQRAAAASSVQALSTEPRSAEGAGAEDAPGAFYAIEQARAHMQQSLREVSPVDSAEREMPPSAEGAGAEVASGEIDTLEQARAHWQQLLREASPADSAEREMPPSADGARAEDASGAVLAQAEPPSAEGAGVENASGEIEGLNEVKEKLTCCLDELMARLSKRILSSTEDRLVLDGNADVQCRLWISVTLFSGNGSIEMIVEIMYSQFRFDGASASKNLASQEAVGSAGSAGSPALADSTGLPALADAAGSLGASAGSTVVDTLPALAADSAGSPALAADSAASPAIQPPPHLASLPAHSAVSPAIQPPPPGSMDLAMHLQRNAIRQQRELQEQLDGLQAQVAV